MIFTEETKVNGKGLQVYLLINPNEEILQSRRKDVYHYRCLLPPLYFNSKSTRYGKYKQHGRGSVGRSEVVLQMAMDVYLINIRTLERMIYTHPSYR